MKPAGNNIQMFTLKGNNKTKKSVVITDQFKSEIKITTTTSLNQIAERTRATISVTVRPTKNVSQE